MLKIWLDNLFNRRLNPVAAGGLAALLGSNLTSSAARGEWGVFISVVVTALIIMLGALSPSLPKCIFTMPLSKEYIENYTRRAFWWKIIIVGMLELLFVVTLAAVGVFNIMVGLVWVLGTVAISSGVALAFHYGDRDLSVVGTVIIAVIGIVAILFLAAENNVHDLRWILGSVALIVFLTLVLIRPVDRVRSMCAELAHYERFGTAGEKYVKDMGTE